MCHFFCVTGENIAKTITSAVQEWQLPVKLGLIMVSDNASNMTKAGKLLGCHLHLGCFAHTLNLAVQRALRVEGTAAVLGRIRRLASYFHRSTLAAALLKSKAELLQMSSSTLKIDVCTRWNSAYDMLARFLELQAAVVAVIRSKEFSGLKEKEISSLNDEEVVAAEELVVFLKPLKDITTYMCSEELPTSSIIMPLLESLVGGNGHLCAKEGDSVAVEEMKTIMKADLMNRYSAKEKEMLHLISAMDPRFKSFPYLSRDERDNIFRSLTDATVSLHQTKPTTAVKMEPDTSTTPPQLPAVSLAAEETPVESMKVDQLLDDGRATKTPTCLLDTLLTDVYITHVEPAKSSYQLAIEEVERFREVPDLKMKDNPLIWWKMNMSRFPLLGRLAQMYLTVPTTSVSSERVFSTAGDIVTAQRANLKPKQVDQLIFLKKNMK